MMPLNNNLAGVAVVWPNCLIAHKQLGLQPANQSRAAAHLPGRLMPLGLHAVCCNWQHRQMVPAQQLLDRRVSSMRLRLSPGPLMGYFGKPLAELSPFPESHKLNLQKPDTSCCTEGAPAQLKAISALPAARNAAPSTDPPLSNCKQQHQGSTPPHFSSQLLPRYLHNY